jgi:hypothetical protein
MSKDFLEDPFMAPSSMSDSADSMPSAAGSSARGRSSVGLFLAAASLATGAAGLGNTSVQAREFPPLPSPELLAQATQECIPIGEGENCSKPRRRKGKSLLPPEGEATTKPAEPAAGMGQDAITPATPAN